MPDNINREDEDQFQRRGDLDKDMGSADRQNFPPRPPNAGNQPGPSANDRQPMADRGDADNSMPSRVPGSSDESEDEKDTWGTPQGESEKKNWDAEDINAGE